MSNYNKNNRSKTFDNKSSINMFNNQPSVFNTQAPPPQTNGFSTQQPSVFNTQAILPSFERYMCLNFMDLPSKKIFPIII